MLPPKTFEKSHMRPLKEFSGPTFRRRLKKMELFEGRKNKKKQKVLVVQVFHLLAFEKLVGGNSFIVAIFGNFLKKCQ